MDDDLVLNLELDEGPSTLKGGAAKKGGRWTDRYVNHYAILAEGLAHSCTRVKAKRAAKRKERTEDVPAPKRRTDNTERPRKKPRKDVDIPVERAAAMPRPPTQIISSLFSSNPKVEHSTPAPVLKPNLRPSNAPLDSSTFVGLALDPLVVTHLQSKMSIEKPTSIQRVALPALLSSAVEDTSSRDVFIQSQTGSGKTLSFLLPIIQDLLPLSTLSYIDRSIGTLAIIIAPTRELAKQISDVLEALLQMRLRPPGELPDEAPSGPRLTRWLVSGLLTGGATRTHEKARLRKGIPILVSTPGRLLDHLQNTSSFNVGKCRWLVLDEADRLMELGFEETITGIVKGLDGRQKLARQAVDEGKSMEVGGWDWERRRRTVLCSATIREDVQKLAGTTLLNPIVIKSTENDVKPADLSRPATDAMAEAAAENTKFTPPSQLSQKFVVVPLKLRLVTLIALLRNLLAQAHGKRTTKIIVFLSCTDSVDFHFSLLGSASMDGDDRSSSDSEPGLGSDAENSDQKDGTEDKKRKISPDAVEAKSPLLPGASIFRLHGSLHLQTRLASLKAFSSIPKSNGSVGDTQSSILLCTSVASRGLDLPLVRAVIQYDLPTEGGATEYVHRVGRTARVGKGGEAWSFVAPSEQEWVKWVETKMQGDAAGGDSNQKKSCISLQSVPVNDVLSAGFGGKGTEFEERATEVQLSFERWVLKSKEVRSGCRVRCPAY
jgi:ATP-dependent RNA helicase DDX31/DBP7